MKPILAMFLFACLFFAACTQNKPLQSSNTKTYNEVQTPQYTQANNSNIKTNPNSPGVTSSPLAGPLYNFLNFLEIEKPAHAAGVRGIRRAFVPLHHRPGWNSPDRNPAVDCVIFNVSEEYATAQNSINPSSSQRVNIYIQNSASVAPDQVHKAAPILSKSFNLAPGESVTVNYVTSVANPTPFPKGITIEAIDLDNSQQGLIQGDCYMWWGNPTAPADRLPKQHAIMGGLPF